MFDPFQHEALQPYDSRITDHAHLTYALRIEDVDPSWLRVTAYNRVYLKLATWTISRATWQAFVEHDALTSAWAHYDGRNLHGLWFDVADVKQPRPCRHERNAVLYPSAA